MYVCNVYVLCNLGICRLACILWIISLRNAICRLRKFPNFLEHIYYMYTVYGEHRIRKQKFSQADSKRLVDMVIHGQCIMLYYVNYYN